jgi:SagB-type dehydrogenase family enzyme
MEYYKRSPYLITYWSEDNKWVVYNYNKYSKVMVSKEIMKILEMLPKWKTEQEISSQLGFEKKDVVKSLNLLRKRDIVYRRSMEDADNNNSRGAPWDMIELAMQRQRSYGGRSDLSHRVGKSPSPVKRVKGLSSIALSKFNRTEEHSGTLLSVLEDRKSIRDYSDDYVTLENLSYFLYNSSRIKKIVNSPEGMVTRRPYPSGGARYPLEIYVVNNKIDGIERGIHYYDPLKHRMILLNRNRRYQEKFNSFLLEVQSPFLKRAPDVAFVITAVFARTMWKYKNIGLSLIMSDLGCLYQTMYLIATDMNLAPCPLGKTHESLIRDWLKLNWFKESHVGTFLMGRNIN